MLLWFWQGIRRILNKVERNDWLRFRQPLRNVFLKLLPVEWPNWRLPIHHPQWQQAVCWLLVHQSSFPHPDNCGWVLWLLHSVPDWRGYRYEPDLWLYFLIRCVYNLRLLSRQLHCSDRRNLRQQNIFPRRTGWKEGGLCGHSGRWPVGASFNGMHDETMHSLFQAGVFFNSLFKCFFLHIECFFFFLSSTR